MIQAYYYLHQYADDAVLTRARITVVPQPGTPVWLTETNRRESSKGTFLVQQIAQEIRKSWSCEAGNEEIWHILLIPATSDPQEGAQ